MTITLEWEEREPPLAPAGLVALGPDATLLSKRLARLDGEVTRHLHTVAGDALLAVLGPQEWLPWSPGVIYLAPDPSAPALYLPTTQRPTIPGPLLIAALTRRFPQLRTPLVCLPAHCFSLAEASPL